MCAIYLISVTDATDSAKSMVSRRGRFRCNTKLIVFVCDESASPGKLVDYPRAMPRVDLLLSLGTRQKPARYVYISGPRAGVYWHATESRRQFATEYQRLRYKPTRSLFTTSLRRTDRRPATPLSVLSFLHNAKFYWLIRCFGAPPIHPSFFPRHAAGQRFTRL